VYNEEGSDEEDDGMYYYNPAFLNIYRMPQIGSLNGKRGLHI